MGASTSTCGGGGRFRALTESFARVRPRPVQRRREVHRLPGAVPTPTSSYTQVLLLDTQLNTETIVSASAGGVVPNRDAWIAPIGAISQDGRYVAYSSYSDCYVYDRVSGNVRAMDVYIGGSPNISISGDGSAVVVSNDTGRISYRDLDGDYSEPSDYWDLDTMGDVGFYTGHPTINYDESVVAYLDSYAVWPYEVVPGGVTVWEKATNSTRGLESSSTQNRPLRVVVVAVYECGRSVLGASRP